MIVKDVTKFQKHHLGDRGMLEYVCARFRTGFEFLGGGELQSSLLT